MQILLTAAILLIGNNGFSQASQPYQNINCITVNNNIIRIDDLQTENTNTVKGIVYNVSFSININQSENFKEVLAAFIKMDKYPDQNKILINKYVRVQLDTEVPKINEQWTYQDLIVDEIILPMLDATASNQRAVLKIKFHSRIAAASYNVKNDVKLTSLLKKEMASLTSSFGFALENLPCSYISKISPINICKSENKSVTLTIAARDIAAWNEVMTSNPSKLFKAGKITYYAPNLRDELFVVSLFYMKIMSIRNLANNSNQIQKYEIVLSFESESTAKK